MECAFQIGDKIICSVPNERPLAGEVVALSGDRLRFMDNQARLFWVEAKFCYKAPT